MSYINDYSDEFQSEHFDDIDSHIDSQFSIQDPILNDLIRLSKDNNIKALRQYISLHKRDLKCYKKRLLNNVIHLDGYKFVRRDDKLMIIKVGKIPAKESEPIVEPIAEPVAEPIEAEPVIESKESESTVKPKKNNFERSESERSEPCEANKAENADVANINKVESTNPNFLANPVASQPYTPERNDERSTNAVSYLLNSLLKQSNDQNEAQKKQYEQLANTLNESIAANNNAEQERTNRLNSVVNIIEKTFSEGTFDKIVESNTKMVQALTAKHNEEINALRSGCDDLNNDLHNISERVDDLAQKLSEDNENDDRIQDLEDRVQELELANQELESENKNLNNKLSQMQTVQRFIRSVKFPAL